MIRKRNASGGCVEAFYVDIVLDEDGKAEKGKRMRGNIGIELFSLLKRGFIDFRDGIYAIFKADGIDAVKVDFCKRLGGYAAFGELRS